MILGHHPARQVRLGRGLVQAEDSLANHFHELPEPQLAQVFESPGLPLDTAAAGCSRVTPRDLQLHCTAEESFVVAVAWKERQVGCCVALARHVLGDLQFPDLAVLMVHYLTSPCRSTSLAWTGSG